MVVELFRLHLQPLEFLLNEVCEGFPNLHLRARMVLACTPQGPWLRYPGSLRGWEGQGQLGDLGWKLTADLFSAWSRSSTGSALKGFPISTVIFCKEAGHQG